MERINKELYPMIMKRKSFHLFYGVQKVHISQEEIDSIYETYRTLVPLDPEIKTEIRIVPAREANCARGEEYCILIYSEKKDNYLRNAGYIGEQLDLYLVSKNIGTLWYGMGKPETMSCNDLDFVIMIAISKVEDVRKFRKDMFKAKRKEVSEIWIGKELASVADIVRFAPSACNTQPWLVEYADGALKLFRYKKPGKRGIMPMAKISWFNQIDVGIFMCFLELCLDHEGINFEREDYVDNGSDAEKTLVAAYELKYKCKTCVAYDPYIDEMNMMYDLAAGDPPLHHCMMLKIEPEVWNGQKECPYYDEAEVAQNNQSEVRGSHEQ